MRDLFLFITIFSLLPFCLFRPWIGILVFSWVSYMNPHRFTWSTAYDFPFAKVIAIVTLLGFLFTKDKMPLPKTRETLIIIFLGIYFTFTNFYAFNQEEAWLQWEKVVKILLMTLLTMMLVNDRKKLKYLVLVIAYSVGFLGIKGGIFSIGTGGEFRVYGPAGSFFADNNDMALALNMALPMLFYLTKDEKNKNLKMFFLFTFVMSIISVIFTYSRGGFITLAAVISLLYFRSKYKIFIIPLFLVVIVIGMMFVPQQWFERIETIRTYEQSPSAIARINAWHTAWNVAIDRPFYGAGFEGLRWDTRFRYSSDPTSTALDVHSIYFEVLGEHGFIAFILFILLMLFTISNTKNLKKIAVSNNGFGWLESYSNMFQISIIAYAIGGLFLGRAYFDLFYHIVALVVILQMLVMNELQYKSDKNKGTSIR